MKGILLLSAILLAGINQCKSQKSNPRVFVFTDINIDQGDPDDRQSLVHLLWYANELEIAGIVTDRWNAGGPEASLMAIDSYARDFTTYNFKVKGYPNPERVKKSLATDQQDAIERLREAAIKDDRPLWVLIWGNMQIFKQALFTYPEISDRIRVITIGTGVRYGPEDEVAGEDCNAINWNGPGRNEIFRDDRFKEMWWLEINWTYNGMFSGNEPKAMYHKLSKYGAMGEHLQFVTKNQPWAQYFRVGDTPSVLYLIDPGHNPDQPVQNSWAGKFIKPFPHKRPYYYTDDNGPVNWNYENPCQTWANRIKMYNYNKSTLENERTEMYKSLIKKLESIYME